MKTTTTLFLFIIICFSCSRTENAAEKISTRSGADKWNIESLQKRASQHLDSAHWDKKLFDQDIETYHKYEETFRNYPLNKAPFPVAEYDYAVSSIPFTTEKDGQQYKGISIGEYENPESEKIITRLTLLIQTNDTTAEENTLVDSRNYPYLTAEGYFKTSENEFDWVFSASPDGFATLLINMKLFDLRFGETIIIYPRSDKSFFYDQINDSPDNYRNFEEFKSSIRKLLKD